MKGIENAVADYLSRLPAEVDQDVNDVVDNFERHLFTVSQYDQLLSRI